MREEDAKVFITTQLPLIGSYRSQLSVFTQGGLQFLIYDKPDFTGFVAQTRYKSLTRTTLTADLHNFFANNAATLFSVALVGKLKYTELTICNEAISNRREPAAPTPVVTYSYLTNLHAIIYIDGELVSDRPQWGEIGVSSNPYADESQFQLEIPYNNKLFDFAIFLSNEAMVQQNPEDDFFFEMYVETWMTEKREVLPNEIFYLNKVDDTQFLSTSVEPAIASGFHSTVAHESSDWVNLCDLGEPLQRVPFILSDTKIQVRD